MNDTAPIRHLETKAAFGSDAVAQVLRDLRIPYIALTPGASFRGLHDSLVNHLGNTRPEMLLCIHEENAVSLAHGYARVANEPLAVALHANVGLMHATMAIFNAWCDRVPIVMLGGVGPIDAVKRRPWVDWIHTSRDLGAMSLAEAVRRLTSHPASVLGLVGRGTIAEGQAGDLLLFDPKTVDRGPKRRVRSWYDVKISPRK